MNGNGSSIASVRTARRARRFPSALAGAGLLLACAAASVGQANFSEGFDSVGPTQGDGPSGLIANGWIFRNQSDARGATVWYAGLGWNFPTFIQPQAGAGYLANTASWDQGNRRISTWAILPAIPGQSAGDVLTIYIAGATEAGDRFQVRYSPTGGTGTGSGWSDVGDFTQLLLESPYPGLDITGYAPWDQVSAAVPGPGRLALRWYNPQVGSFRSPVIGIDSLTVGEPPCNQPPVPSAGQTVTWTAAGGPYQVCDNLTIPTGGTVIVEAGARVEFANDRQLFVNGTLDVRGTAGAPVVLAGVDVFPPYIVVRNGMLEADFADFGQQLRVERGATVGLHDCTFTSDGTNLTGGMMIVQELQDPAPFVVMERCTFTDSLLWLSDCLSVLRDNTFIRTTPSVLRGYADLTAPNTLDGAPLSVTIERPMQPFFIDNVSVSNFGGGAGLQLSGSNFLLGPGVSAQNNLYPVRLDAGLDPASHVPTTGNTFNKILAGNGGDRRRWPNFGIPYLLEGAGDAGILSIDPGVTVEARAGTSMWFVSTNGLVADGTPEAPVVFKGENGVRWDGLMWAHTDGGRLEHAIVRDANIGVIASDAPAVYLQSVTFENNATGANANTYGGLFIEKSRFVSNSIGLSFTDLGTVRMIGGSMPNALEGNGAAMDAFEFGSSAEANQNWWGHPTGPQHPQNPSGQGDAIIGPGAGGVSIFPFLAAPPDFGNTVPLVRMLEPGFQYWRVGITPDYYFEPGEKVILAWSASDDGAISGQSIKVALEGHYPGAFNHTIAANLAPSVRAFEMVVPDVGFAVTNANQYLRIGAVDEAGQEGWDQTALLISSGRLVGNLSLTTSFAGQTFHPGDAIPDVFWTGSINDFPSVNAYIVFEAEGQMLGSHTLPGGGHGTFLGEMPFISTDAARLAIRASNNSNDVKWFFSTGYFSVRHDPRFGFVPPAVQLQSPAAGASFAGGTTVPISWTASDSDDGLHSFDLQASYNGGKTWRLIAEGLPPEARSFDWRLPASTGIPDVRLRVIARDRRFQNSTSGHDRVVSILPGQGCAADFNGDGELTVADFTAFRTAFLAGDAAADFNGDGELTVADFTAFRGAFLAGCP